MVCQELVPGCQWSLFQPWVCISVQLSLFLVSDTDLEFPLLQLMAHAPPALLRVTVWETTLLDARNMVIGLLDMTSFAMFFTRLPPVHLLPLSEKDATS